MKLNVKSKLLIFILLPIIIFIIIFYISLYMSVNKYENKREEQVSVQSAEEYTTNTQKLILSELDKLNTFKSVIEKSNMSFDEQSMIQKDIIINKQNLFSTWILYNTNQNNAKLNQYIRLESEISLNSKNVTLNNYYYDIFLKMKNEQNDVGFFINNNESDIIPDLFSLTVPLYRDNNLIGIAGFDFNLKSFLYEKDIFRNSNYIASMLVFNKKVYDINVSSYINESEKDKLKIFIKNNSLGIVKSYIYNDDINDAKYWININPINLKTSYVNISLVVIDKIQDSKSILDLFSIRFLFFTLLSTFFTAVVIILLSRKFFNRLKTTSSVLNAMSSGNIEMIKELDSLKDDEISYINNSINQINRNLDKTAYFIEKIASGDFNFEYKALTEQDNIGNSLVKLKINLEKSKNAELERKKTDERLNWATIGTAKFSEIIREHSDNLEELAYVIISDLVNYIDANQGGLFIINEENNNKYVELLASYAYSRRKMLDKKIPWGVGLVGRCIQEKETIFITKIPDNYLNITSGLGEENPANLLIVPLIFHEEVFGVVELASFSEIEKYKINLVEQISESIASAIQMVKINVRTAELLRETKIKSEQTASQEEEIRQNIEEMQASTDELNNKLEDINSTFSAINSVANIAQFDLNGRITDISDSFLKMLKKEKDEIIGKVQGSFSSEAQNSESFKNFWKALKRGKTMEFEQVIKIEKELLRINSVYIPVKNSEGEITKVVSYAVNK